MTMTCEELVRKLTEALEKKGLESAKFEALQIVRSVSTQRFSQTDLTAEQVETAEAMLERRLENEPLQYILGEWEFCGLPFKVGPGVLIPRQDTEALVETALPLLKKSIGKKVFDLCAGSGCIGISLAKLSGADVTFFEKSHEALKYLRENVNLNGVKSQIKEYDVLGLPPAEQTDMIVSNPPYIRTEVVETLDAEVKREPKIALDGGEDGLVFYRHIANVWKTVLTDGGYLIFEIGYDQGEAVTEIMKNAGYKDVTCKKDLCGNDRIVMGRK